MIIKGKPDEVQDIPRVAVILAGGLGTRLRSAVPDLPKCMAPVAGRPFLFYVINFLRSQGIERFVFSLGYRHEVIEEYLTESFPTLKYELAIESEPLGTGGAIHLACQHTQEDHIVVTNGDTLMKADLKALMAVHLTRQAACTLALKPMQNFDRYGVVTLDESHQIKDFHEKKHYDKGLINGGLYILDRIKFITQEWPHKFSFETEFLEKVISKGELAGLTQDVYFIDIGVPEDFTRVQNELARAPFNLRMIDKTWTLFLDRDGVINEDHPGSYIFTPGDFSFMEGAPALFKTLTERFGRIIIATNQRGVGKNLMTEHALNAIHSKLIEGVEGAGGRIDAIYFATGVDNDDSFRKPNPGMAIQARRDFPQIDMQRSIMIGNNISDVQFARNAGMYTVMLRTTNKEVQLPHPDIDLLMETLADFAKAL